MRLGVAMSMFYALTGKREIPEPVAIEFLNRGFKFAV